MLALERQKKILEILERDGAVMVSKLSAELSVTDETVRRDLEKLASGEKIAAFTVNDEYVVFLGVRRPVETKGE